MAGGLLDAIQGAGGHRGGPPGPRLFEGLLTLDCFPPSGKIKEGGWAPGLLNYTVLFWHLGKMPSSLGVPLE